MSDEDSKNHARVFLESAGYFVTPIPKSKVPSQKRADLKATFGQEILIVEAKGKEAHRGYFDLLDQVRKQGYGYITRDEVAWNALSSVVEQANRQLESTPAPETSVRILWISCLHDDWSFVFDGFRHRLYGDVELSLFQSTRGSTNKMVGNCPCFYFEPADFCRYRSIDAAVLAELKGACILVNEFGSRVRHLRDTRLYTEMKKLNALCDPEILRESGKALAILDSSLHDQKSKWTYLFETYGFMTSVLHGYNYKALMAVDIDSDE